MMKFDPINLGAYKPENSITLGKLYSTAVHLMAISYLGGVKRLSLVDEAWNEEREEEITKSIEMLEAEKSHPMWFWSTLRHFLCRGDLEAFVINDTGLFGLIAKETWYTDYALTIFSTGRMYDKYVVYIELSECDSFLDIFSHVADDHPPSKKLDGISSDELRDHLKLKPSISRDIFDRDIFYKILICQLYNDGLPELKRGCALAFRQKLIDTYVAENGPGGTPSMAWVKARVLPIMRRLRGDGEEEVNEVSADAGREADNG